MSVLPMNSTPISSTASTEPELRTEAPETLPAPVLITEQEVLLGSAVAGGLIAEPAPHRRTAFRRIFARAEHPPREKRRTYPPRCSYLESSRLSREMGHL